MAIDELPNVDAEATADLLERARRSACWLQTLTENLSSATCLETGTFDIRPETIDVLECVESATALVKALLEQRRQTVRITCSAPSTSASADPARVTQIVANLLTNASRYSVEGDEIEVHLSSVGPKLRVRVTDHGPGISPEAQQRIFERWVRGEDAARGGLGLGLNIVRRLVEEQGGRVGVDSTLGQGATFWFTLQAP